eukprot:126771_1
MRKWKYNLNTHFKSKQSQSRRGQTNSTTSVHFTRPKWSQNVSILYDNSQIWSLQGIVVPISTVGRPSAPKPYNGAATGTALGTDKGHIMALSNGGPDVTYNIVPQSNQWQRTGGWRQLEIAVFDHAMSKYGWNETHKYLASEIGQVKSPGTHNFVIFNVTMSDYDAKTGEPMQYIGFVQSGYNTQNADIYSFTITPPNDAIWSGNRVPPTNGTFIESTEAPLLTTTIGTNNNATIETTSTTSQSKKRSSGIGTVLWIALVIFLVVVIAFGVYKCIKRRRLQNNVNSDYRLYYQ